jgi:hypothetical protein
MMAGFVQREEGRGGGGSVADLGADRARRRGAIADRRTYESSMFGPTIASSAAANPQMLGASNIASPPAGVSTFTRSTTADRAERDAMSRTAGTGILRPGDPGYAENLRMYTEGIGSSNTGNQAVPGTTGGGGGVSGTPIDPNAGKILPALSDEEQALYETQLAALKLREQTALAEERRNRDQAMMQAAALRREALRRAAGSRMDIGAALAESGVTSPALSGMGMDVSADLANAGAARLAAIENYQRNVNSMLAQGQMDVRLLEQQRAAALKRLALEEAARQQAASPVVGMDYGSPVVYEEPTAPVDTGLRGDEIAWETGMRVNPIRYAMPSDGRIFAPPRREMFGSDEEFRRAEYYYLTQNSALARQNPEFARMFYMQQVAAIRAQAEAAAQQQKDLERRQQEQAFRDYVWNNNVPTEFTA